MNDNFLVSVAKYIAANHKDNTENIIIVLPNIRAGLYLRRCLSEILDKVSWAPKIVSVQDFFHQQSGLQTEEQIPLVFELYKSFQRIAPDLFESFDLFYPWGEIILSDFNDVDKNLVEAKQLFANITDLKKIELLFSDIDENILKIIQNFWSQFEAEETNYAKERFLAIWQHIYDVYLDFRKNLLIQKTGYEGLIYRHVAEELDNQLFPEKQNIHYFVGFNVLSQAEEKVLRLFKNQHNAKFLWQYDEKLLKNPDHEAFRFIREYIKRFPMPDDFDYQLKSRPKSINVYAVPSRTAQVKLAAKILKEKIAPQDPDFENTGLILPDESLLQPVLFSIPEEVKRLNVSMGFPISNAPQSSIIKNMAKLQENAQKETFYHKDVVRLLNHPLLRAMDNNACAELKQKIIKNNWIRIPSTELHPGNTIFNDIFRNVDEVMEIGPYFSHVLKQIYETIKILPDMQFDCEIIYQIYRRINRFNEYLIRDKIYFQSSKTYLHLISGILNSVTVAFSGEPMHGLQVLGMLETRMLDFNKIIICSMNEGHFPSQSFKKSFIPYNLRKAFQLSTIELQDAIHAYYFYRMIMHPDEVYLLYNTSDEGFMKGEKSRYIQQLLYESSFPIVEIPVHIKTETLEKSKKEISKNEYAMQILEKYKSEGNKSFSPSQLNTYLHCSMAFYYKYILGIREEDELVDQIGAMELGNVLHNTMNMLYQEHIGKIVTSEMLNNLLKDKAKISKFINIAWAEQMKKASAQEINGLNALGIEAVHIYINRILKLDKEYTPFTHIGGELDIRKDLSCSINGQNSKITLRGSIDHLDQCEDGIRVIDYKTGKGKKSDIADMETLFTPNRKSDSDHVFQVLFYSWLCYQHKDLTEFDSFPISPAVLYTRENRIDMPVSINKEKIFDFSLVKEEWEENMCNLLKDLYNKDIPFRMTTEATHCKYCPFRSICF